MLSIAVLLAAAATAVDYGWQPLAGGGFEYIIQIEPEVLDALLKGQEIASDLPPDLRGIRSYRVRVGSGDVPRVGQPPAPAAPVETVAEPTGPLIGPANESIANGITASTTESQAILQQAVPKPALSTFDAETTAEAAAIEQTVGFAGDRSASNMDEGASLSPRAATSSNGGSDPWWTTMIALTASLAANGYLAWITLTQRQKYRQLLSEVRAA